jgi:hypothetical protein
MSTDQHVYGEINGSTDMKKVFTAIRRDVDDAGSRPALTELYRRAGYLITLTHAPAWAEKFGRKIRRMRAVGEVEFRRTANKINRRARELGAEANFDDEWGN